MADWHDESGLLSRVAWPLAQLGEALETLAHQSGLTQATAMELPAPPHHLVDGDSEALDSWIDSYTWAIGVEAEPVETPYSDAESLVSSAGPAILRMTFGETTRFLALLEGNENQATLIGPDLKARDVPIKQLRNMMCHSLDARAAGHVDHVLENARVPKRRRKRAREAMLRELLGPALLKGCWLLRLPPAAGFWQQLRRRGLTRMLYFLVSAHTVQYLLFLVAWWMIGRGALQGRLDQSWLIAWALLLMTLVPLRAWVTWLQGVFAIGTGGLMKRRLLQGALRLDPEDIRHQGAGQLLGRVVESEAFEAMALGGGFLGITAIVELVIASTVLAVGSGGFWHVLLLFVWVGGALFVGYRYIRRRHLWTELRLSMTHDLVERMVGHRTRLAQEKPERWHDGEDQAVDAYLTQAAQMDRTAIALAAITSRGWLFLGLLAMAPGFVSATATPAALAVGLGGVLLAQRALNKLSGALVNVSTAAIAWQKVAPLFNAAARKRETGTLAASILAAQNEKNAVDEDEPLIEGEDLAFSYPSRPKPVLSDCRFQVRRGQRLLLEGPSGGGKSTLASLLVGLRQPTSGLLLLNGLDHQTIGLEGWRKHVVAAPQFHENHVFTETFAFNLLMGRRWPATPNDLQEAETLCRELGLGELLDRMPAGLLQMVGETGWQLSHGERSRLFLARAMMQDADFVVLDESFAALDPENLHRALKCVLERAPTLLVIAHP